MTRSEMDVGMLFACPFFYTRAQTPTHKSLAHTRTHRANRGGDGARLPTAEHTHMEGVRDVNTQEVRAGGK